MDCSAPGCLFIICSHLSAGVLTDRLVCVHADEDDEKDDLISAVQFLLILEESIRTFMTFLRADKRSHYEMFREMVKRRVSAVDQTLVVTLKKANKKVSCSRVLLCYTVYIKSVVFLLYQYHASSNQTVRSV